MDGPLHALSYDAVPIFKTPLLAMSESVEGRD